MNIEDSRRWQDAVLHEILIAIASSQTLTSMLVFKGARILAMHIPDGTRQSLDIDANCSRAFLNEFPQRSKQASVLEEHLTAAIRDHFESQSPVKFQIKNARVRPSPPKGHPHGWNAFEVALQIADLSRPSLRSIPSVQLDIAYPETLTEYSTTTIDIGGRTITAYSLERIAGEKLRAFLSSLPAHQEKLSRRGGLVRAKDLYDLAHILRHVSLDDELFWKNVGSEFRVACKSRCVDCTGGASFEAAANLTREVYEQEQGLPRDLSFEQVWASLKRIATRMEELGIIPFAFDLPASEIVKSDEGVIDRDIDVNRG